MGLFKLMLFPPLAIWLISTLLCSCAGPSTPFGAIHSYKPVDEFSHYSTYNLPETKPREAVSLNFSPPRQMIHKTGDFVLTITDLGGFGINPDIRIFYEGHDLGKKWLKTAKMELDPERRTLTLKINKLKLLDAKSHKIFFTYGNTKKEVFVAKEFKAPECPHHEEWNIKDVTPFSPPSTLIENISKIAKEENLNPALIAGLIAQESGFNTKAVSRSKALGLTQITPIAATQIQTKFPDWSIHPASVRNPYRKIKRLVRKDKINAENDWRLNPSQSIKGGSSFINYIIKYWNHPYRKKRIKKHYQDPREAFSDLLLASYNSGAARVSNILRKQGSEWRKSKKLKEATRYINRVQSFCYHFSHPSKGGVK